MMSNEDRNEIHKIIENAWRGARVKRKQPDGHTGTHIVVETLWDEKGALHCKDDAGYWTPAAMLDLDRE